MSALKLTTVSPEAVPMDLLLMADPSEARIRSYLPRSRCGAALLDGEIVGVVVLLPITQGASEIINISVHEAHQAAGIGSKLLKQAIAMAEEVGAKRIELGTGTFGHQLTFYQRAGFRAVSVAKDFFLKNYEEPIYERGIQHKDMLRLALELSDPDTGREHRPP